MKVMTIVGTRPEIIKLACVIPELDIYTEHVLVHTGQNYDYELNEIFFDGMGIRKPDIFMNAAGKDAAETIGNVIIESDKIFKEHRPDAVLLYGDTNSCLASISAKRNKIPVFHMEAGNRCFDQRVPEELNRKVVDHLSDINMTLTEHARRYLVAEGIRPETVIKVGSSMKEVLSKHKQSIDDSNVLDQLGLSPKGYFYLALTVKRMWIAKNFTDLIESISAICETYKMPVIFSVHPRTQKLIDAKGIKLHELVQPMKPLGFADYIKLQQNAYCVISDSGTITEESSLLGFPAITVRQAHERPEGMDEGTLIMTGLDKDTILDSIKIVTSTRMPIVKDYDVDNVSQKGVRIIMSYTGYINRTVWKKGV
ncbi:UDP-N-acetylglucosamine 2-epimerase (non-hydrolyzing) [Candidatus Saccharibacteria bacterium]|nr:MAG: UDP-N-acetylglucosamine 2-epimerase (non-hydrolyzing) [Candidatus Saccharibacteria bacterium]